MTNRSAQAFPEVEDRPATAQDSSGRHGSSSHVPLFRHLWRMPAFRHSYLWTFRRLQALGVNVTPNHFYWPIPDLRILEKRAERASLEFPAGVDLELDRQERLLRKFASQYGHEWNFPTRPNGKLAYHYNNGFYESVDAEIAYSLVRAIKPRRMIEIGGGYSTRVLGTALRRNAEEGAACEMTTIEPFPSPELADGSITTTRLIPKPIQEVPLTEFDILESGDILFVDSSHVVSMGSDVCYEILQVLPRLSPGVTVHFHDIFIPSDYPMSNVTGALWFWSEQYLLQAFLACNYRYEVVWSSSAMALLKKDVLRQLVPSWNDSYRRMPEDTRTFIPACDDSRVWPSSFWIRSK